MTWGQVRDWEFPGGWWFGRRFGGRNGREYSEDEIKELQSLAARCEGACCQTNLKPGIEGGKYAT